MSLDEGEGGLFIRSGVAGADRVMGIILWDCASSVGVIVSVRG